MDRIKTAAEIAMERIKKIDIRSDTVEKHTEYIKAAKVLASALLENKTNAEKIMESLKRYPQEAMDAVRKVFFQSIAGGINLSNTPETINMIHHLTSDKVILEATDELNAIFQQRQAKLEQLLKEAVNKREERALQELAAEGIRGSAIYRLNPKDNVGEDISSRCEEDYHMETSGFRSFLSQKA